MGRFIKASFILRNMIAFSSATLVACFIAYYCLSFTLTRQLGESFRGAYFLLKSMNESTGLVVWFAVVLYGIVISIFILAIALFATHKVAGPIFRLESLVDSARRGVIQKDISFRTQDQIVPLAGAVSRVFSVIGEKEDVISRLVEDLEKARQRLGELILAQNPGWLDQARAVKGILDQFALLEQTAQKES